MYFVYVCTYMYMHTLVRTIYMQHARTIDQVHIHHITSHTRARAHAHSHGNSSDMRVDTQDILCITIQSPLLRLNKTHTKNIIELKQGKKSRTINKDLVVIRNRPYVFFLIFTFTPSFFALLFPNYSQ